MFGGPVLSSLADQLFAFERPGWEAFQEGSSPPYAAQLVLDALAAAVGSLEDELRQPRRRPPPPRETSRGRRRAPRILIGRIYGVPSVFGFLADLATVGVVGIGLAKWLGLW
jgi:hypothetical protein